MTTVKSHYKRKISLARVKSHYKKVAPLSGLSPVRGQELSPTAKVGSHEQRVKTNPFDKSKVPLQEKDGIDNRKVPLNIKREQLGWRE